MTNLFKAFVDWGQANIDLATLHQVDSTAEEKCRYSMSPFDGRTYDWKEWLHCPKDCSEDS